MRDAAINRFFGEVHHQGDVHECTLAALPFLIRLVQGPGAPAREQVLGLIASIGGVDFVAFPEPDPDSDEPEIEDPDGPDLDTYQRARRIIGSEQAVWVRLLADEDPGVREAATFVLTVGRDRATAEAAGHELYRRYADEPVAAVRSQIVTALSRLAPRVEPATVADWLRPLIAGEPDLLVQLTALAHLARLSPEPTG